MHSKTLIFEIPMSSRSYEFFLLKSLISTYNTSFLICIFIIFTNILLGSGIIWICNIFIFGCNFPSFFLPYCIFFSTFLLYFLIQNQYMTKTFHWIKKCCFISLWDKIGQILHFLENFYPTLPPCNPFYSIGLLSNVPFWHGWHH